MQVGNARYLKPDELPDEVAVFPLSGALLLPGGQMPLNVFEPRYLAMFDAALASNRLIGIVQPALRGAQDIDAYKDDDPYTLPLASVGCLGRITSFGETGDGRYIASLSGICRFRLLDEKKTSKPFRSFHIVPFMTDLSPVPDEEKLVDRARLLATFRAYLDANNLEADWDSVEQASNTTLVNSVAMMSPFGPAEKQALLEAPDLKSRAETLIAITEIILAQNGEDGSTIIQ